LGTGEIGVFNLAAQTAFYISITGKILFNFIFYFEHGFVFLLEKVLNIVSKIMFRNHFAIKNSLLNKSQAGRSNGSPGHEFISKSRVK
jgi:hypothetical protein